MLSNSVTIIGSSAKFWLPRLYVLREKRMIDVKDKGTAESGQSADHRDRVEEAAVVAGLRRALEPLLGEYDAILIDCPPSLGICTINGLTAAGEVLIPLQCETLSSRGVGQLLETVEDVRSYTNAELSVRGVIATMYDGRTKLAASVIDDVRTRHGLEVIEPRVPKSVRVAEAPGLGRSILTHSPKSMAAEAYRQLARAIFE